MMASESGRLIVVLGMHRSGTSAITRALRVLGVHLGDTMMPAVEGNNEKGFWEDVDLNALNDEMLQAIGSHWDCVAPLEAQSLARLRDGGYYERAAQLLALKAGDAPLFGFKDPRVAKLLPFWQDILEHSGRDVGYVLQVRHPMSVAASLSRRDGFAPAKSYLLWLGYVIEGLAAVADRRCVLVDYDGLMRAPEHELQRIAKALDLAVDPAELDEYRSNFLDPGLRHTVHDLRDLEHDPACPPLVYEVYAALLDVAADRVSMGDPALTAQVRAWVREFERLGVALLYADTLRAAMDALNQQIAERDNEITRLRQSTSFRLGYYLMHPWKIPSKVWQRAIRRR